jgi:CheY-like chemotaxis protein
LPKRVLVVEDESLVAILVEDLVADLGCEVVGPVSNAVEARAAATAAPIDFALLDVNLGNGETSFEAADILLARGVPFAFVTGSGAGGVRADLRHLPILDKPIDPASLSRLLAG